MSNTQTIVKCILEDNLVDAKKHIHANLLAKLGTVLEEQILEVAPSMINEKELSPKQKNIAKKAGNPNKIEGEDFAALRKEKTNESVEDSDELLSEHFQRFVEEVQQIVEEIEEETGEELSDEEIKEIGEEYLQVLNSLNEKYDEDDDEDDGKYEPKKHKKK